MCDLPHNDIQFPTFITLVIESPFYNSCLQYQFPKDGNSIITSDTVGLSIEIQSTRLAKMPRADAAGYSTDTSSVLLFYTS